MLQDQCCKSLALNQYNYHILFLCLFIYISVLIGWTSKNPIFHFIICQMFIVQAHWWIPSQMAICNQAYFLPKTILIRQYYSILFSIMMLLLWCYIVLLWHHIVLLFDRNVTQVLLWYLTLQYDITIVAPCPRL